MEILTTPKRKARSTRDMTIAIVQGSPRGHGVVLFSRSRVRDIVGRVDRTTFTFFLAIRVCKFAICHVHIISKNLTSSQAHMLTRTLQSLGIVGSVKRCPDSRSLRKRRLAFLATYHYYNRSMGAFGDRSMRERRLTYINERKIGLCTRNCRPTARFRNWRMPYHKTLGVRLLKLETKEQDASSVQSFCHRLNAVSCHHE